MRKSPKRIGKRSAIRPAASGDAAECGTQSSRSAADISATSRKILDQTTRSLAKVLKRLADR